MKQLPIEPLPVLALTPEQAAAACNVSRSRIDEWTHRSDFPVIRDGKAVLIPLEPLKRWLAEQAFAEPSLAEQLARLPLRAHKQFRIGSADRRPGGVAG